MNYYNKGKTNPNIELTELEDKLFEYLKNKKAMDNSTEIKEYDVGMGWPHYKEIAEYYANSYNESRVFNGITDLISAKEFPSPIGVYSDGDIDIEVEPEKINASDTYLNGNCKGIGDSEKLYCEINKRLLPVINKVMDKHKDGKSLFNSKQIDKVCLAEIVDEIMEVMLIDIDEVEDASLDMDKNHWNRYRILKALAEAMVIHRIMVMGMGMQMIL